MKPSAQIHLIFLGGMGAALCAFAALGESYYLSELTRLMIFALGAASLYLILGFGGLVSLGHAAFMGLGGYASAILAHHGFAAGWMQLGAALAAGGAFAFVTGAVALRTRGAYFIMITLAFAQMAYFLAQGAYAYGGDDGMALRGRVFDPFALALVAWVALAAFVWLLYRMEGARFGRALIAARMNEARTAALGFDVFRIRLAAYVLAGMTGALAGFLFVQHTGFISPSIMHWTRSGELMVMVILGGMGHVMGPVWGAVALLLLEDALSSLTQHWAAILGPLLVALALFAKGGIAGVLKRMDPP